MGYNTKISWCDHTWNPVIGCTKVSEECRNCYAEALAKRYGWAKWGHHQPRYRTSESNWEKPLMWNKQARADCVRRRVFCASLSDIFDAEVGDGLRNEVFQLIDRTPHLDWLLLTKRAWNAARYLSMSYARPNVWIGASVGVRASKERIDDLRETPAVVRFLSCEPLLEKLGELDLTGIHWVIAGGESGPRARPMPILAYQELYRQCRAQGVPPKT